MTLRKTALRFHRWLSLSAMAFWLIQALTGVLIVFHWEIDDALLSGERTAIDLVAIEKRIEALTPPGSGRSVGSVWESGGSPDRFDLYLDEPDGSSVIRIDGAGEILRTRTDGEMFVDGGWIDTLVLLHHNLLSGDVGSWIVGISGLLLLSNLIAGLTLAWPRRGGWRRALVPPAGMASGAAGAYAWHRALGLWVVVPAFLTVSAAVLLVFAGTTEAIVRPPPVAAPSESVEGGKEIGFAAAVSAALRSFPGSRVSGINLPADDMAFYKIRLLQPGESRRIYGTTTVFVRAADGQIVAGSDALNDGPRRSFVDGLFPFHTGEMGGTIGRIAVMAIGIWLIAMIVLGFLLWRRRSGR